MADSNSHGWYHRTTPATAPANVALFGSGNWVPCRHDSLETCKAYGLDRAAGDRGLPIGRWWWRCEDCGRTFNDPSANPPEAHDLLHVHVRPDEFAGQHQCRVSKFQRVFETGLVEVTNNTRIAAALNALESTVARLQDAAGMVSDDDRKTSDYFRRVARGEITAELSQQLDFSRPSLHDFAKNALGHDPASQVSGSGGGPGGPDISINTAGQPEVIPQSFIRWFGSVSHAGMASSESDIGVDAETAWRCVYRAPWLAATAAAKGSA